MTFIESGEKKTPKTGIRWHADLGGEDGNAFVIMGVVRKAIKATFGEDWKEEASRYAERARSGDYENLLVVTREYIEIADHRTGSMEYIDNEETE